MKPTKLCLLALASVALLTASVRAAIVTATSEDLILGFQATEGTGSGVNLEIDLGSVASFYNASPGSSFILSGVVVQDLVDTYGSDWFTRTNLYWGAAAHYNNVANDPNGKPAATIWITDTGSPAPLTASADTLAAPGTRVDGLYNGWLGSLNGQTSTSNSSAAAVISKASQGSWTVQETGGNSFGFFNPKIDGQMSSMHMSNLYELQPSSDMPKPSGSYLGTLIFAESGLSFQAVPEPSTWVMVGLGLGMMVMVNRPRKSVRS